MSEIYLYFLVYLLNFILLAKGIPDPEITKIVGGELADILDYPFQVSLRVYDQHICGGSILDSTTVITAAHCTRPYPHKDYTIRVGNSNKNKGIIYSISKIIEHPDYNKTVQSDKDCSIIKLIIPILFGPTTQPIPLIPTGFIIPDKSVVTTLGWGVEKESDSFSPELLRKVDVLTVSNYECGTYYGRTQITKNMICALDTGKDSCQGDSGGPLVYEGQLCGVVSFGAGCARPGIAGVYTNIAAIRPWIEGYMNTRSKLTVSGKAFALKTSAVDTPNKTISNDVLNINIYPYQVSLRYRDEHVCGGTIIDAYTVLTAAHCTEVFNGTVTDLTIRVGSANIDLGEIYEIKEIFDHPNYNETTIYNNDISVLKVSKQIIFNDNVQAIELIEAGLEVPDGEECIATAWEDNNAVLAIVSNIFQTILLRSLSWNECQDSWKSRLTNNMMCCIEIDALKYKHNPGGSLTWNNTLVGIESFATINVPEVFTKVSVYRPWIEQYMGNTAPTNKIVGGECVRIEDYPYQVSLRYHDKHHCGAVILDASTILTAAHCVDNCEPQDLTIRVGNSNHNLGTKYQVARIIVHPEFNIAVHLDNDVAILKLDCSMDLCDSVQPICLAECEDEIEDWCLVTVTGWGTTKEGGQSIPDHLQMVELRTINNFQCGMAYGHNNLTNSMMCAIDYGKDSCQGDSGGPLTYKGKLYGIVSSGEGCARPGYPGIYAKISTLRPWIDQYLTNQDPILYSDQSEQVGGIHVGDKIIGGKRANIENFPCQASLRIFNQHLCGAVIVGENTLLTAAHCAVLFPLENYSLRVGSSNRSLGTDIKIASILIHPSYNVTVPLDCDIAILKLTEPLIYNETVQSIEIIDKSVVIPLGAPLYVSGWGIIQYGATTISDMLMAARLRYVDLPYCQGIYGQNQITNNMICAREPYSSTCEGDTGGPLIWRGKLAGISSFNTGCTKPGFPGVYVNTSSDVIYGWIMQNMS